MSEVPLYLKFENTPPPKDPHRLPCSGPSGSVFSHSRYPCTGGRATSTRLSLSLSVSRARALSFSGRFFTHTHSDRNVNWFRGGLVLKAHRLLYHSTLGLRVIKKKKTHGDDSLAQLHSAPCTRTDRPIIYVHASYRGTSLIRNTPLLGPYSRTVPRVL